MSLMDQPQTKAGPDPTPGQISTSPVGSPSNPTLADRIAGLERQMEQASQDHFRLVESLEKKISEIDTRLAAAGV